MGLRENQFKFAKMIADLIKWCYDQGYSVRLGDAWRSTDKLKVPGTDILISYQDLLVANGRSKVKVSKHNDRLAMDLLISKDGKELTDEEYRPIGEKWEAMGGIWGGRFGVQKEKYNEKVGWDAGHFEI
jgi:hypothetical protein